MSIHEWVFRKKTEPRLFGFPKESQTFVLLIQNSPIPRVVPMTIFYSFFYGLLLSGEKERNQLGIQPDTLSPSEKILVSFSSKIG
jgi:hypothetical protein